jgi:hypothetical protein
MRPRKEKREREGPPEKRVRDEPPREYQEVQPVAVRGGAATEHWRKSRPAATQAVVHPAAGC